MSHTREEWKIVGKRAAMVAASLTALGFLAWLNDGGKPPLTPEQRAVVNAIQWIEIVRQIGVEAQQAFCPVPRMPETAIPAEPPKEDAP